MTIPSDMATSFEEALDTAGIKHDRPLVHSASEDAITIVLQLVVGMAPRAAEIITAFSQRNQGKEVHWDEHSFDAKGYSAEDILKFMKAASSDRG